MTKEEIEKQFPELAAELRAEGVQKERTRVLTHLKLGKTAGADLGVPRSLRAIEAGEELTDVTADYLDCQLRQRDINARQQDSDLAAEVLNGAARPPTKDGQSALADEVERQQRGGAAPRKVTL